MSIKSTQTISRETAIARIKEIHALAVEGYYLLLEEKTFENEHNVEDFVHSFLDDGAECPQIIDIENLHKWTNSMLEDQMDEPFYRFSMFDNYTIA
jgi:hypothetical protein